MRLLVVDDDFDSAEALVEILKMAGHDAVPAQDGEEALRGFAALRPSVVILDLGLPGMDGLEVARRLRERADFGATVLVALTGYGQESDRARALEAGFDAFFVKPTHLDALLAFVDGIRKKP